MIKLYINESAYIKEDIEAVKKYYPNIEDNMQTNQNMLIQSQKI